MVYCPKSRVLHPHRLWERMRSYMESQGVLYDFVQSDGPGSVERLVHMLVKGGYRTIGIVGGDGAPRGEVGDQHRRLRGVDGRRGRELVERLLRGTRRERAHGDHK